ncbi:MAG: hypothetical protein KDA75_08335 [Planctomycetaceae bacterium]|nr:hypothetical protein [Planctomycetaceae bacterium]
MPRPWPAAAAVLADQLSAGQVVTLLVLVAILVVAFVAIPLVIYKAIRNSRKIDRSLEQGDRMIELLEEISDKLDSR